MNINAANVYQEYISCEPAFEKFTSFLLSENKKHNLTAIRDPEAVKEKHFMDSLSVMPLLNKYCTQSSVIGDFGTGAGFPGIPLKIVMPEQQFHLIESNGKKTQFLQNAVSLLELKNIEIHTMRMENFTKYNFFDILLSRAVCYLPIMMEFTIPFLRKGGRLLAFKGSETLESGEYEDACSVEKLTAMKIKHIHEIELNGIKRIIYEISSMGSPARGIPRDYSKLKRVWKEKCQKS